LLTKLLYRCIVPSGCCCYTKKIVVEPEGTFVRKFKLLHETFSAGSDIFIFYTYEEVISGLIIYAYDIKSWPNPLSLN
jgi:hypothetical protein